MRPSMFTARFCVVLVGLATAIACGAGSPTSPSSLDSVAITVTGTGVTTYTYTKDIAPIMASDCVPCHGTSNKQAGLSFSSYAGVMAAVTAGSQNSLLVKATQPQGPMYVELSGNRTAKAQLIYDWVVNSKATQ